MRDLEVAIPLAEQGRVRLERAARRQLAQRDVLDAGREVCLGRRRGAVGGGGDGGGRAGVSVCEYVSMCVCERVLIEAERKEGSCVRVSMVPL